MPLVARRALLAVAAALWAPDLRAEGVRLVELQWSGMRPTFPVFRARATGDFEGEVEARIATRADPMRYRPYLAFARLASALGSPLVPRADAYAIPLRDLLGSLAKDPAGLALLKEDMAILNDGRVTVLVSEPSAAEREIEWATSPEIRAWRGWAESRRVIVGERPELASGYGEALVLDYLAGNPARGAVSLRRDAKLILVENGGAFHPRPDRLALDQILLQLKRVTRFSRRMVERLRAFQRPQAEQALHAGPFGQWLVASRPITDLMERRHAVLSLVNARAAEHGEASALPFP